MSDLTPQVRRRRTFAIISHPDAGKTTLTEKLLLYSGAIQIAGSVKARKASRHATSDWMEIEKQRGISVTSSVMQFDYRDRVINLLDTPGPGGETLSDEHMALRRIAEQASRAGRVINSVHDFVRRRDQARESVAPQVLLVPRVPRRQAVAAAAPARAGSG